MLNIGCHLSISKGFLAMGKDALKINANAFQFFTRNPRGSQAKAIDPEDTKALQILMEQHHFAPALAHAPYTLNPCSVDEKVRNFAFYTMQDDMARMEFLPGNYYNFHPGSHVGQGVEAGIEQTAALLNAILIPEQKTMILLETMAGKGSEIGSTFKELKAIMDGVQLSNHLGICLDTCHVFDAGYDIVNDLDAVLDAFENIIGLSKLKAIHLNDSMNPIGSHKDRHAKIGEGHIGLEALSRVINHPKLRHLPFYLETPNELDGYAKEIELMRSVYLDSNHS